LLPSISRSYGVPRGGRRLNGDGLRVPGHRARKHWAAPPAFPESSAQHSFIPATTRQMEIKRTGAVK
jgi:hypothetical protein